MRLHIIPIWIVPSLLSLQRQKKASCPSVVTGCITHTQFTNNAMQTAIANDVITHLVNPRCADDDVVDGRGDPIPRVMAATAVQDKMGGAYEEGGYSVTAVTKSK